MISFKDFIAEDAPVNSGVGGAGIATYDPILNAKKQKKSLYRRTTKSPSPSEK